LEPQIDAPRRPGGMAHAFQIGRVGALMRVKAMPGVRQRSLAAECQPIPEMAGAFGEASQARLSPIFFRCALL
jgi:hypothetical protein